MTAAAGLLFQFVWAELSPEVKSLQEYRVIEKRYRTAARTVSHIALLNFENGCF
jgi:hypothetical protein